MAIKGLRCTSSGAAKPLPRPRQQIWCGSIDAHTFAQTSYNPPSCSPFFIPVENQSGGLSHPMYGTWGLFPISLPLPKYVCTKYGSARL